MHDTRSSDCVRQTDVQGSVEHGKLSLDRSIFVSLKSALELLARSAFNICLAKHVLSPISIFSEARSCTNLEG